MDESDDVKNFVLEEKFQLDYQITEWNEEYNMDQVLYFQNVPVNRLKIICWIPCRVKQYNNIGTNKIKTQSTSPENIKMKNQNYKIARKTLQLDCSVLGPYFMPFPNLIKKSTLKILKTVQYSFFVLIITKYSNNHCHTTQFSVTKLLQTVWIVES